MTEKRTLSSLLRDGEVYVDDKTTPSDNIWREALLEGFEHSAVTTKKAPAEEARSPLQWHHLGLMAPAGLGLFSLGWILGSGISVVEQMSRISPAVWVGIAVLGSGMFFFRMQLGLGRR